MNESQFIYKFAPADYYVMIGYLLMLVSIGIVVKKLCSNVKDYFIGGNKIPWWLAGTSCFMMSFSAWTFTGAAGFAYQHGILIALLFYYNVIAFLFAGFFIAAKVRQTRRMTFAQIIYDRFGRLGEQFFLWIQVPNMLFGGAIWLMGLATFVSVAFGVPMAVTIIVSGAVILIYSTLSGSWAVMTTDFLQSLVLMTLSIVIVVLTLGKIGGLSGFVDNIDASKLTLFSEKHSGLWAVAYFSQIFMIFNSVIGAPRYLAVKDGKSAQKVAYLAAFLFLIGPPIWFIPPIAASYYFPNITEILPQLNHPQDGAYVLMGLEVLPQGLAGLLIMVIFAATLSSMDSAVNQNAAIVAMNIYKPLLRPRAGDREMFIASRIINFLCGVMVTATALLLSRQHQLALFDLMLLMSGSIGLPLAIPCFLLYWFKKTPPYSAVVSVLFGGAFSFISHLQGFIFPLHIFGILAAGTISFFACGLHWKFLADRTCQQIELFYEKMDTPVDVKSEIVGSETTRPFLLVGILAMVIGIGLLGVVLFPGLSGDRLIVVFTAGIIFVMGLLLYVIGKRSKG